MAFIKPFEVGHRNVKIFSLNRGSGWDGLTFEILVDKKNANDQINLSLISC